MKLKCTVSTILNRRGPLHNMFLLTFRSRRTALWRRRSSSWRSGRTTAPSSTRRWRRAPPTTSTSRPGPPSTSGEWLDSTRQDGPPWVTDRQTHATRADRKCQVCHGWVHGQNPNIALHLRLPITSVRNASVKGSITNNH